MNKVSCKSHFWPMKCFVFVVSGLACLFGPQIAAAAERTICFRFQFSDDRSNCPTMGTAGARRACDIGVYKDAIGHYIELWDKDNTSDDEKIGTWVIGGSGTQCATFEWEGASYSKGEENPDVYVRYIYRARKTGSPGSAYARIYDTDGSGIGGITARNGLNGDPDFFIARDCRRNQTCTISNTMVASNDVSSTVALRVMTLDSAQHSLQVFGDIMDTHLEIRYPGQMSCGTSCSTDRKTIHIASDDNGNGERGNNGFNVAHEVGHSIQQQEFNRDSLRDDCSRDSDGDGSPNSGHNMSSIEHESCATTEGWANYVGAVSWYEPNNSATVPFGWNTNLEDGTPAFTNCTSNAHNTRQVAKAFWDLDDWNDEAAVSPASQPDGPSAYSSIAIAQGWRQFSNGTGNREEFESGRDGVNMRDYWSNNSSRFDEGDEQSTLIQHNCLQAQTNG